jgi:hypothetical protein
MWIVWVTKVIVDNFEVWLLAKMPGDLVWQPVTQPRPSFRTQNCRVPFSLNGLATSPQGRIDVYITA